MRIDRWICVEKRAFMHISFDSSFWANLLWFVIIMAGAGLIIWLLLFVNKKVFSLLSIKQRGIHLVFFERMNKVIIIVAILILAFSALDSGASVWKSMLGGTAIVSAVVAFAAQDVIREILGGLMISLQKPFEIGDRIELSDGTVGIVEDITNRHVVLIGLDTLRIIVPNSKINSMMMINYSFHRDMRSVSFRFPIGYNSDIALAKKLIAQAIEDSPYTIPGKKNANGDPIYGDVYFISIADSALMMSVTVYYPKTIPTERVKDDVHTRVFASLQQHSIEIPYNYISVVNMPSEPGAEPVERT